MTETKISAATLTTAASTDLVPIGRPNDTTARHVTVATLVQAQQASATARGSVELATDAEAITGEDTERAITPANLAAAATTHVTAATSSAAGKVELATSAEAITGEDTERAVTPAALAASATTHVTAATTSAAGKIELATTAETQAGTDDERAVTPAGLKAYFEQTIPLTYESQMRWTSQTTEDQYNVGVFEAPFEGVQDPVFIWGWNITSAGRIDATDSALWQQFEHNYKVGDVNYTEWNFNAYDTAGNNPRFMAFLMDKTDYTDAYWWFWIGNQSSSFFRVSDIEANTDYLAIAASGIDITGTFTPTSNIYAVDLMPIINPGAALTFVAGVRVQPVITVPASTVQNTNIGLFVGTLDITEGSGADTYYNYNLYIDAAPTEGTYGNWSLYVNGRAGFESGANFGCAAYDDEATDPVDIVTGTLRQRAAKTPSSAGDTGRAGQICWDANYVYVCVSTNTWKRSEISTWA